MEKYINNYQNWLTDFGLSSDLVILIKIVSILITISLISYIADIIAKQIIIRFISNIVKKTKATWDDIILEKKVFNRLAHFAPALVIHWTIAFALSEFPNAINFIQSIIYVYMTIVGTMVINSFINALHEKYIDPNSGKLLESNKGIKEMRISAAWLQGRDITTINDENEPDLENDYPPVIQVHQENLDGNEIPNCFPMINGEIGKINFDNIDFPTSEIPIEKTQTNLQYKFFLRKTQKLAFITEKPEKIVAKDKNGKNVTVNINNEFEILTFEDFKKLGNKNFNLIITEPENSHIEELKTIAPVRILKYELDSLNSDLKIFNKYENPTRAEVIEGLNNIYIKLYETWIKKQVQEKGIEKDKLTDGLPMIAICDIEHLSLDSSQNKYINTTMEELIEKETIIYRTHNDTISEFIDLKYIDKNKKEKGISPAYKNSLFIEGITGHNSTSRLVRNEKLDNFWALKMIESALTNVCIIDERIWERLEKGENQNSPLNELYHKKNIHVFTLEKPDNTFQIIDSAE